MECALAIAFFPQQRRKHMYRDYFFWYFIITIANFQASLICLVDYYLTMNWTYLNLWNFPSYLCLSRVFLNCMKSEYVFLYLPSADRTGDNKYLPSLCPSIHHVFTSDVSHLFSNISSPNLSKMFVSTKTCLNIWTFLRNKMATTGALESFFS